MALQKFCLFAMFGMVAVVGPAVAARAQAAVEQPRTVPFNIPAGNLVDAITAFQDQSGSPPTGFPTQAIGQRTAGVSGNLPPRAALEQLLSGTGLTFLVRDDGGFMIEPLANVRVPGGRCIMDKRKVQCREE